ncbi:hypothetical protein [Leifsonia xyli]|uniref:hypothetical protein n=1 Tax=Leifsonia xyli TaxID=1575 RepID=UPI003D665273
MRTLFRTLIAAGAVAGLLPIVAAPVASAHAEQPAAQLSVTLANSEKTVKAGDRITYTGHVKNLGATEAKVTVVLDAPGYVELGAASGAEVDKNTATWTPTIAPGGDSTFTIPAAVGKIPSAERRVTTLASVYVGEDKTPIVRTADASHIQGVKDTPGGTATAPHSQKSTPMALPWVVAGTVLLLLVVVAAALLLILRRRRRLRRSTRLG